MPTGTVGYPMDFRRFRNGNDAWELDGAGMQKISGLESCYLLYII